MSSNEKRGTGVKNPIAIQKARVEKLMKNPDKLINIPGKKEEKLPRVFNPPEFYRNVWGSSAGAGSGDFHLYRCIRRREYARERYLDMKSEKEELNNEFAKRLDENKQQSEAKTAKKRAKRQKKKMNQKGKKAKAVKEESDDEDDSESEDDSGSDEAGTVTSDNGDVQQPHRGPDGGHDSALSTTNAVDSSSGDTANSAAQQGERSDRSNSASGSTDTGDTITRTHDAPALEH